MRKPPTGEPCAGKLHARFGGRGGLLPFPTPIFLPSPQVKTPQFQIHISHFLQNCKNQTFFDYFGQYRLYSKSEIHALMKNQWIDLSFNDPGQDHMMLGADGFWILIGCPGKGHKVSSQITQRHNFIHQTVFCTEEGS
jgi:hypothetical protein